MVVVVVGVVVAKQAMVEILLHLQTPMCNRNNDHDNKNNINNRNDNNDDDE